MTFSSSVFAISNDDLEKKCLEVGKAKIAEQAKSFGCTIDLNKVEVQEVDNRWYNPSKYVSYRVLSKCNDSDRLIKLVQYSSGKCDDVPVKKQPSTSDAELGKKCLEVGKLKIAEQAKAFGCSVDLSKVEVQEVDNRWYNPSKYIWYQAMNNCNNADRIVTLVQYSQGKCVSNGSIANASLKNAVETVIKDSSSINSSPQDDSLKISNKQKNVDLKVQPSLDNPSTGNSSGVSK